MITNQAGRVSKEIRTFGTMTHELLALADWLAQAKCTHVAMESTGVYWKPIYNLLEDQFELLVVNAHHLKAVPGRKTDVKDAQWIADLLRHGLVRGSFVPPAPQRELRDLTRHRTSLVGARADHQSAAENTGRCESEISLGGERYSWGIGAGDVRSAISG